MKVLDLGCGAGGWSIPFIEDGDEVWGIDIKNHGYPGHLIEEDIRNLDGYGFHDMDFIIGSPPCTEFSGPKHAWPKNHPANPKEGVALVKEFERLINEAQPKYWALENIANMTKWYNPKTIWRFRISHSGRRLLWGTLPIPLGPEFRFKRVFGCTRETRLKYGRRSVRNSVKRAMIPYPIARFIADTAKASVKMAKPK
jgi:site-specific DNA-cytosine methylase